MAYSGHDNRVKHLNGTSGCTHYRGLEASSDSSITCASHHDVCKAKDPRAAKGTRGCHVIMANQNARSGTRYIIYCCPSCNGDKHMSSFDVRSNAVMHNLDGQPCRNRACGGRSHPHCDCGHE